MSKFTVMCNWEEVPHLTREQKDALWASIPPYQRDARTKGIPQLGSGAIYPIGESDIIVRPFEVPNYWPRCYALDVGWNRTAAIWGALNVETDTVYLYNEYYRSQAEPAIHAAAIRARGEWIPGVIDPAARGRSQVDGVRLIEQYGDLGLFLQMADRSVDSGLLAVWNRLSTGRLKIFETLPNWRTEYRLYRRDEHGKIVKKDDHLMDATRYLIMSGLQIAALPPPPENAMSEFAEERTRNSITGY